MSWTYTGGDSGIGLFGACVRAGAPMVFTPGMRILEIGCNEADWLTQAHQAWPTAILTGIDQRCSHPGVNGNILRQTADALDGSIFEPETFDAVVMVSALEHMGLGHYGDHKDRDGDTKVMTNVWKWLKPGGFIYFDVPYDPTGYKVLGTECRIYNDDERWNRLWVRPLVDAKGKARWLWDGYVSAHHPSTLIEKPTVAHTRYWYWATVWLKV